MGSIPGTQVLDMIAHFFGGFSLQEPQQTAHLSSNGIPLLWRQNNACMLPDRPQEFAMQGMKVSNIESVEDSDLCMAPFQLRQIRHSGQALLLGTGDVHLAQSQRSKQIALCRILVQI